MTVTPVLAAIIGLVALLIFMAIRIPIAFGMAFVGVLGVAYMRNWEAASQLLAGDIWGEFSSYTLTAIPTFILMGNIAFKSGLSDRLYKVANAWVGHLPGGLANTTILASAGFGAICGSGVAATATMTTVAMPEMRKYDYDPHFSGGMLAVAGTLGSIIPPSLIMIVVATTVGESVGKLFIAGILPGLFLAASMLGITYVACRLNPRLGPPGPYVQWGERFRALSGIIETLLIFILVIGGIYAGFFTPTEAGGVGAAGVLLSGAVRRRLTLAKLWAAITDTVRLSTMVVFLIFSGVVFGRFISLTRLPYDLISFVSSNDLSSLAVMGILILLFVLGGMFMDSVAFLVLSLPIFMPLVLNLGYDPIWFLLLTTVITSVGSVTPPVGVHIFVVNSMYHELNIMKLFRWGNIYSISYVLLVILLLAFPEPFVAVTRGVI